MLPRAPLRDDGTLRHAAAHRSICLPAGIDTACQPKHYREDLVGQALGKLQQVRGRLGQEGDLTQFASAADDRHQQLCRRNRPTLT